MIRVKNEITAKDINGNVNSQLIKPMAIRFLIGFVLLAGGVCLIILNKIKWLGIILAVLGGLFDLLIIVMYFVVRNSAIKQNNFNDKKIEYELRNIKENNPSLEELTAWYKMSGLPLKKFFNTSGLLYKSMELKDKLPTMTDEEQLKLLATDGMLVKRPLVIGESFVLVGFKESEWEVKFK